MDYYSAIKRNEILYVTLYMNLKDIMLSEISQTQMDKYCMSPLKVSRIAKFTEIESRIEVSRSYKRKGYCLGHIELLFKMIKKVLEMGIGGGCPTLKVLNAAEMHS